MYGYNGRVKNWMIDAFFEGKINDVPEEMRDQVKEHCKDMKRNTEAPKETEVLNAKFTIKEVK